MPFENPNCQNVSQPFRGISFEIRNHVCSPPLSWGLLWFIDTDAQPVFKRFPLVEVLVDLVQFVERCSGAISVGHAKEALHEQIRCCCGAVWPETLVSSDAVPQTKIVPKGVQSGHCPIVCKVAQPSGKRACSHQRLAVEYCFQVEVEETLEHPLCVWSSHFFQIQPLLLLVLQPFLRFCQGVEPRGALGGVGVMDNEIIIFNVA